jgi:hypothetical protein
MIRPTLARLNRRYAHLKTPLKVGGRADDLSPAANVTSKTTPLTIAPRYSNG